MYVEIIDTYNHKAVPCIKFKNIYRLNPINKIDQPTKMRIVPKNFPKNVRQ